jgi:hypothetical protein
MKWPIRLPFRGFNADSEFYFVFMGSLFNDAVLIQNGEEEECT